MDKLKFGLNIKAAREKKKLTQSDLAKILDVTPQHICQIEKGKKGLSLENIIKLCEVLNIKEPFLFIS